MPKCDNCPRLHVPDEHCASVMLTQFGHRELQADLLEAIKDFYLKDIELLNRNANEVCITSHIFHYFASRFASKYKDYNIDPEYNRNGFGAKYYERSSYAKPDLIIHKRNCNRHNLLYLEFKVNIRNHDNLDKKKIVKFVSNEFGEENGRRVTPYRYKYGVSVLLNNDAVRMLWYNNGQENPFCENRFSTETWEMM